MTHSYNTSGLYTISLTVTDDEGLTDINTTTAIISLDTDADGWSDEMEISYNTSISDAEEYPEDTDGDGIPDEDSPDGKYTGDTDDDDDGIGDEIEVILGTDPKSKETFTVVEIDGKTFYLIDTNNDGTPDKFVDSESGKSYKFEVQSDGTILIDTDGDGEYDYVYDPASGTTQTYEKEEEKPDELPVIPIVIIVVVVIILILFFLFKKGYLYIENKK